MDRVTRSYNEVAKYVRNALRPYSVESIVNCALNCLAHFRTKEPLEELRSAPWLSLLIVKIALQDNQTSIRSRSACSPQLFDKLRQILWEASPMAEGRGPGAIHLALRVMLHTQLQFQAKESWSFLRWPALVNALPSTHPTRKQFESIFQMQPGTFIGLCWSAYSAILDGQVVLRRSYFDGLRPLYGDSIDSYFRIFSRDIVELRTELRRDFDSQSTPQRSAIELAEFPWAQRFPLLKVDEENFAVWHPLIFARAMENAVHQMLSHLGQQYTDPFSKVFEKYVLDLLDDTKLKYIDEASFKKQYSGESPSVEAIVAFSGGKILVESKMSLFPEEVVLSDNRAVVFKKLRRAREAIVQGWRVTDLLFPEEDNADSLPGDVFLIVVASKQLNLCNGAHLSRIFGKDVFDDILPESKFGSPKRNQRARLPPENMFFLSIEEFEHLSACLCAQKVDLLSLLKTAASTQSNASTSVFHFDQLLSRYTERWSIPRPLEKVRAEVERQLVEFLEQADNKV